MVNAVKPTKGKTLKISHFPTEYQALIFRLWEMVPCEKIAKVIETEIENVKKAAEAMGLPEQKVSTEWESRGYISIIRAVWNLLPYEQIFTLLDWDENRLDFVLKEDDFIGIKLGEKCDCPKVLYRDLTEKEAEKTAKIRKTMLETVAPLAKEEKVAPFEFLKSTYEPITANAEKDIRVDSSWGLVLPAKSEEIDIFVEDFKEFALEYGVKFAEKSDKNIKIRMDVITDDEEYHEIDIKDDFIDINAASPAGVLRAIYDIEDLVENAGGFTFDKKSYKKKTKVKTRFIYSFCGLYGDVLEKDTQISFPDELLKGYARRGINGVWLQGILYQIAPYPFVPEMSKGYEERIARLEALTKRAARYGIKVYIYMNEPRRLENSFFEKHPDLAGWKGDITTCLCTSHKDTQKYLKDAIQFVCKKAPLLGGFFVITQSENSVSCYSAFPNTPKNPCPVCSKRAPYDVTAELVNVMADAAYEVNPKMKFFAYAWNWGYFNENFEKLMERLSKNVIILQVSESGIPFTRGGVEATVRDYSLSIVGPGEAAKEQWSIARSKGLEVAAKVQINNSWECSSAPYIPVYENVIEHMENLIAEGVEHIMLSWTLGGYISDNIKIASAYFFEDTENKEDAYDTVLENTYGSYKEKVKEAVSHFCAGFREYPFHITHIYRGPSNAGAGNLLYPEPSGMEATMTCYPYDDMEGWRADYPPEVLEMQYKKLCDEWEKGLKCLEKMPDCEFYDMALYCYMLFKSSLNQVRYYMERNGSKNKAVMDEIVKNEKELSIIAYRTMLRNSAIGYEASNHYYVTRQSFIEKIVQCDYLLENY